MDPDPSAIGPALIQECESAEKLAVRLVRGWLEQWMFADESNAADKAEKAAGYFADYEIHQSHSLGIDRDQARAQGVRVEDLETNQELQDAVLSVHHATMHTLSGPAVKLVENHLGRTYAKITQQLMIQMPVMPPTPGGHVPPGSPGLARRQDCRLVSRSPDRVVVIDELLTRTGTSRSRCSGVVIDKTKRVVGRRA